MMKALCWEGIQKVKVENVPDPQIINPHDAIVKVTSTAICGSDLHLYNGWIPAMKQGDILGHEFMGEIVDLGPDVKNLKIGDRVVIPFTIACGHCFFCEHDLWSACDNSNPNATAAETMYGASGSGLFGYSHIYGGYSGGQAEYVRVPFADVGACVIDKSIPDEKVLFLSDIFPTGYMAAENCNIQPGDAVAIWGCGPVGQFAIRSALMLGARQVIAIDRYPERLEMASQAGQNVTALDYTKQTIIDALMEMTGGIGPDSCIDAVGMEAHATGLPGFYDRSKQITRTETDRPHALREAIQACRKGGTVSIPGVYGGLIDKFNLGSAFAKGLTLKMGQTHVHKYMRPLLERIYNNEIDPSFVITHRMELDDAAEAYKVFKHKDDNCIKVVLQP